MFTLAFLKATAERAVKTFAQALAALLVADGTDLLTTDWAGSLSVAGMAAVVSVLTSVASSQIGGPGPSVTDAETLHASAQRGYHSGVSAPVEGTDGYHSGVTKKD